MTDQSMRGMLAALEQTGELHRVERQVDPRFELGAGAVACAIAGPPCCSSGSGPARCRWSETF